MWIRSPGQDFLYSYPLMADEIEGLLSPNQPSAPTKLKLVPPRRG